MGLTKTTVGVTNISDLSSTPNATEGLTAAQLQAKFDKTGADLKTYINDTLTEELDSALALKSPLANPTFTGTVVLPSTTSIGNVSSTEIGYVDGVTSAIQTQLDSKKLYSKIITATRDAGASSGDVSYTGVGFMPTSMRCLMNKDNSLFQSDGCVDSAKTAFSLYQSAANVYYDSTYFVMYSDQGSWLQGATVKSYDADGFTLTWTKTGTPTAGTIKLKFICYK